METVANASRKKRSAKVKRHSMRKIPDAMDSKGRGSKGKERVDTVASDTDDDKAVVPRREFNAAVQGTQ